MRKKSNSNQWNGFRFKLGLFLLHRVSHVEHEEAMVVS